MSHTDKTRPWWVQEKDPLNNRFKMVGCYMWPANGADGREWHWKKMYASQCWCCSQSKTWYWEEGKKRAKWRVDRQDLIKRWYADRWYRETLRDY